MPNGATPLTITTALMPLFNHRLLATLLIAFQALNCSDGGPASAQQQEPPPPGNAPEPVAGDLILLQDTFEGATLAAQLAPYATRGTIQRITDGHSGAALRFAYSASSTDNLIEGNFATTQDVYFRYWYRTTPGADPTNGDIGSSGMKWFMAWRPNSTIRYTFGVNSLDNAAGPPSAEPNSRAEFTSHDNSSSQEYNPFIQNIAKTPKFTTTNDGGWHKYTLHVVTGTGPTDTRSGYEQIWIDGVLVLDTRAYPVDHDPTGIALIQFPGTVVSWDATQPNFNIDVDDLVVWHH